MNSLFKKSILTIIAIGLLASSLPYTSAEAKDPLKDVRVRKALTLAIDKQALVDYMHSGQQPATGLIPESILLSDGQAFRKVAGDYGLKVNGNIAEAKKLLADAGYPEGKGIPKFTLYYNTNEGHKAIADFVSAQWKENLGVDINMENDEWSIFQDRRHSGDFDIARSGWVADYHDPISFLELFTQDSWSNDAGWANDNFDSLIKKSKYATGKERDTILLQAEKILMTEMPVFPVYYYTATYQLKSSVTGAQVDNLGKWFFGRATVPGGKLVWNMGSEPSTLDPGLASATDSFNITNNTFEGLMRYENGKILPAVAESYKLSTDKKTYTFKIRKNAKWSDGKAVTANDFVYAWMRNLDPKNAADYAFMMFSIEGAMAYYNGNGSAKDVSIKAIDSQTLQVKLTAPVPYFTELISQSVYFPLRKDMVTKGGKNWAMNPKTSVSNGPFKLKQIKAGDGIYLEANEQWWNAKNNKIKFIDAIAIVDEVSALTAYEENHLHLNTLIPTAEIDNLMENDKTFKVMPYAAVYYYTFNLR